jgi:outer membrane protein assembly factor BamA
VRGLRAARLVGLLTLAVLSLIGPAASAKVIRGKLVLLGATKTSASAIEARMGLEAGAPLTFESLQYAEERLIASDLFTSARVYVALPRDLAARMMYIDEQVYTVDLNIELQEKHSWVLFPNASFGGGDQAGGLVFADQNFLGDGMQVAAAAQYGVQKSYGFVGFRNPKVHFVPITYSAGGVIRQENIRFYRSHKRAQELRTLVAGGEAQVGWVYSSHFRLLGGALYRRQWLGELTMFGPDGSTRMPYGGAGAEAIPFNTGEGNIVVLGLQMLYDRTSAPDGFRRGTTVSLKNEVADRFWKSDFEYFKIDFSYELYGFVKKTYPSLILRTVLNYPTSDRGVPVTELLRVGGADLRGYLANEFRGDTLLTLQLEEAFKLVSFWRVNLAGAVFADAGALLERHPGGLVSVNPNAPSRPKLDDFHTSVGIGLRILIPGVAIPAVKLDFAYGTDVNDTAIVFSVARGAI